MKTKLFLMGMLSMVLTFGFMLASCATMTYNASVTTPADTTLSADILRIRTELASFKRICGIAVGRNNYDSEVRKAVEAGKTIDIHIKNYYVFQEITAYKR